MQNVIGSYVVYDPTGRDMPECFEVGQVTGAYFAPEADDGNPDGTPRVILQVRPNGPAFSEMAVTHVAAILDSATHAEHVRERLAAAQRLADILKTLDTVQTEIEEWADSDIRHALDIAGDELSRARGLIQSV